MALLSQFQIDGIEGKLVTNASLLEKLYKVKKNKYQMINVDHNVVDCYVKYGWKEGISYTNKNKNTSSKKS